MYKVVTEEAILKAKEDFVSKTTAEKESLIKATEAEILSIREQFVHLIEESDFSMNAFVGFEEMDIKADSRRLPEGLYIGKLKHPDTGDLFLPAILPFAASSATGFCVDDTSDANVSLLMQLIAMRLLLSVPVELVKCHFVDLHSFGQTSKYFNKLSDKTTSGAFISDRQSLSDFISELEGIVSRLNRNELLDCASLSEYNADPSHIAVPYHFVFVSHIHDRIDQDVVSRLYSLCSGKNAASCGIFLFYSIDKSIVSENGENTGWQNNSLRDLLSISATVDCSNDCFRLNNTPYGKDYEQRYEVVADCKMPSNIEQVIEEIDCRQLNVKPPIVSFDETLESLISSGDYWKGNTTDGITIPIGRKGANGVVNFTLGGNTADFFAMIGGRPGYGKTVLLHDIICNGSIIYSPQELEFYLIDCTNGTGFKPYEHLPHARFVSITKQREYTDSAIDHLINEMYRRADLFKAASEETGIAVEKIEKYRPITGQILPRIVVIIDEFQVLLEKGDKLSYKIGASLEKIIREGRKYGISIVFCTQSYRNIQFDTDLITLRIAFNLKEYDSDKVLGSGNDAAAHLTKKGEAILNNRNGEKDANINFKAAFTDKMDRYVRFCTDKWEEMDVEKPQRFVFDGKSASNIGDNCDFINSLTLKQNEDNIVTYLGVPMFIRANHSCVSFRNGIGSNLLICGTDVKAALSTIAVVNYQLCNVIEHVSESIFIADYFIESSDSSQYLRRFSEKCGIQYLQKRDIASVISQIEGVLKRRIDDAMEGKEIETSPIILTLAYMQSAQEMRLDAYGSASETGERVQYILKNGPDYGIHLIVYAYNYKGLSDVMEKSYISSFGNRITLQGGAEYADDAATISEGTALLVTEDGLTTYEQDPFVVYNDFSCDCVADPILNSIFSIYKKK